MATPPVIQVLVGPNGAGKSTLYARVIEPVTHLPFVNAAVMLAEHPELYTDAYEAGRAAAERRNELIEAHTSFATETVFSHPSKIDFLRDAVDAGYLVYLHVVAVPIELAVARVAQRVAHGGHNVAERTIRSRYSLLWTNVAAALPIARELTVYYNSKADGPKQIAHFRDGQPTRPIAWPDWAPIDLQMLATPPGKKKSRRTEFTRPADTVDYEGESRSAAAPLLPTFGVRHVPPIPASSSRPSGPSTAC